MLGWLQSKKKEGTRLEAEKDAVAIKAGNVQSYPAPGSNIIQTIQCMLEL